MEVNLPKADCLFLKDVLHEVSSQELTQEVHLSDGMPDVGRILGAWGQVILRSKQWNSGEIGASGGVMVWILYLPENGDQPRCLESWVPFHGAWPVDDEKREGTIRLKCLLRFADARTVSARKIMLRLGVGISVQARIPWQIRYAQPGQVPEGVQLLKNTYPVRLVKEMGEKPFLIDDILTVADSCPRPEKLLYYMLTPSVQEKKVVGNRVVFRGTGNLHVLYLSEEGQIYSWDFDLPFSQFADLGRAYGDHSQADAQVCVTSLELELDDESRLRIKAGLLGQYQVDDLEMLEIVEDAYSTADRLEPVTDYLELPALLDQRMESLPVRQEIRQEANLVADVSFLQDFPRQRRNGEQILWEVSGQIQTLSYSPERMLQSAAVRVEDQISMQAHEDSRVSAQPMGFRALQAEAGPEQIRVSAEQFVEMETCGQQRIPMVTGFRLEKGQVWTSERPSVILRRVNGDRLWDIAKSTGATVEAIRTANALEAEPEDAQILLIPVG